MEVRCRAPAAGCTIAYGANGRQQCARQDWLRPHEHECGFYLQLHNDNIQDATTGVRNEYNRAHTRHEEQALRAQPQQPTRFCPSTGATPFLDAFLSSESMPTPTVDLATGRFRATGGIGERMVQTEEDVAAVRDFIFGSQLTSTDGALNSISAE